MWKTTAEESGSGQLFFSRKRKSSRSGLAHAVVAPALGRQLLAAARLDEGQLELAPEHLGQLLELDLDLQDVLPLLIPRRAFALALALLRVDRVALLARALAHAVLLVLAEAEVRQLDLRHGHADRALATAGDQLGGRQVLAQILADLAAIRFDTEHVREGGRPGLRVLIGPVSGFP